MSNLKADSKVTHREQCPKCADKGEDTHKDNLAVYDDGHTHCHKCSHHTRGDGTKVPPILSKQKDDDWIHKYIGEYYPLPERKIRAETVERYGVKVEIDKTGKAIKHHYPYHNHKGELVGM